MYCTHLVLIIFTSFVHLPSSTRVCTQACSIIASVFFITFSRVLSHLEALGNAWTLTTRSISSPRTPFRAVTWSLSADIQDVIFRKSFFLLSNNTRYKTFTWQNKDWNYKVEVFRIVYFYREFYQMDWRRVHKHLPLNFKKTSIKIVLPITTFLDLAPLEFRQTNRQYKHNVSPDHQFGNLTEYYR